MSWVEKVKNGIIIKTGDGREFTPEYFITSKSVDYNIAEFNFPNIEGTLVKRGTPLGAKFNFRFVFQGENHLDQMFAFEKSAKDPRPWTIIHPLYDTLLIHPTSLDFDPSGYNTTEITGSFIETIVDEFPRTSVDPKNKIKMLSANVVDLTSESFGNNVTPSQSDLNTMTSDSVSAYESASTSITSGETSDEYFQLFNETKVAIFNGISEASTAAQYVMRFINAPALFEVPLKDRLSLLVSQFLQISQALDQLNDKSSKSVYQMQGGAYISAMINATTNPIEGDLTSSNEVLSIVSTIQGAFNQYVANIDSLSSENGLEIDGFMPDFESLQSLQSLVNYGLSQLFTIALNGKQERTLLLEKDSNPILLAHRFYGLEGPDEPSTIIESFMNQNEIGLSEIFIIPKGRLIKYYV